MRIFVSLQNERIIMTYDKPQVMGIINMTDDSFYASSRTDTAALAVEKAAAMLDEGADILDIGGCSTRPGCKVADEDTEIARVIPAIRAIAARFPRATISVDTFRARVAEMAADAGAHIINDISGGDFDPEIFPAVARLGLPYILMHTKGMPDEMTKNTVYGDVTQEVISHLSKRLERLMDMGVKDVIVDPGFGFAKNAAQNFQLLRDLREFKKLGCPVLAGMSRKGMVWKTLGITPDEALNGTTVLNTLALVGGADILRVHDVRAAVEAVRLVRMAGYAEN